MMLKRAFAALVCAVTILCGAASSGQAANLYWLHSKPLINRPSLGGLGTPGRGLDVALGLADVRAGRTSTAPLNMVLSDGVQLSAVALDPIAVPSTISASTTPISFRIDRTVYAGGFSTGVAYEVDAQGRNTTPIANVARSFVRIADASARTGSTCAVATTGLVSCADTKYVGGVVTAWDPTSGTLTIQPTERAGSGAFTIAAGNAVLVRHYPEYAAYETTGAFLTTASGNTMTFKGQVGKILAAADWDIRSYPGSPTRGFLDMDVSASNGVIRLTQSKLDWAANVMYSQAIFGGQNSAQAFSVDHTDLEWTPFRDAYVVTVAADTAAGGNAIAINEAVPQAVSDMVADITRSGTLIGGTIPYNGRTIQISMQAQGIGSGTNQSGSVIAHVPLAGMRSRAAGSGRIFGSTTAL